MSNLSGKVFWCEIKDPTDSKKKIRLFSDLSDNKIYIEQGTSTVEMDVVSQGYFFLFLANRLVHRLSEVAGIPKDVETNDT